MTIENKPSIPQELEAKIEEYALSFLRRGRKEWDEPHTRAVVHYVGEIATAEGLDILVLKTSAWLHDIGYNKLFEGEDSKKFDQVMDTDIKVMHMINGAKYAKDFLNKPEISGYYSEDQKERIIHLVSIHDKIEELTESDEIALMESDTLGAIDISRVSTTFSKEDAIKYIKKELIARRYPKFKTDTGFKFFSLLFPGFAAQFV